MSGEHQEERAVSPVVGVAILVGITVILASVVGAFVFGLVDIGESSPDASFTFSEDRSTFSTGANAESIEETEDQNVTTVRVVHNSGQAIQKNQLFAAVSGNKSDPQSNDSVYQIDYQGDDSADDWHLVLNDTNTEQEVVKPGDSFTIGFYGIRRPAIAGTQIVDYFVNDAGSSPPIDDIGIGTNDATAPGDIGKKLGECDMVEIVWRSASGAQGQVLQSYQVSGTECV
jgi:flagellin-like protein